MRIPGNFPMRHSKGCQGLIAGVALLAVSPSAHAAEEAVLDSGDTAWMLMSCALVLLMTLPGLALFYGGLVRSKNVLSLLMQCLTSAAVMGLIWVLVGYSIAFGADQHGLWGWDSAKVGLRGVAPEALHGTIPELLFAMFQGMFLIITPALMIGAFAERMRFGPYIVFSSLWAILVYLPLAHMVWGGGWIGEDGALDFAGGLVVHMSSGYSALAAALFLGPRKDYGKVPLPPHNMPLVVIGTALLWVGWFGFNAGSELAADATAALALVTTTTAASAATLSWILIEWIHHGRPTVLGAATGAVAGLVAITPGCAFVTPLSAIAIGFLCAPICYFFVALVKIKMGYDDSLDVFGVHGIGGTWGALATAIFAAPFALDGVTKGEQLWIQLKGVGFTALYAPVATLLILVLMRTLMGNLRVSDEGEHVGLDQSEHSENAYVL